MIRHCDRVVTALLVLLLLAAPLPFGGVTPWAAAGLLTLAFCALLLAAWAVERPAALRPIAPAAAALAAVALLGLFQALPLPESAVALLSPEHARIHRQASEVLGEVLADGPAGPRLTLAVSSTHAAALAWAAAAALLVAAAAAGRTRAHRRWLAGAVLAGALFQVVFGARGWFARSRTLWGVELQSNPARLRGTFVNPNHLALYLGMALPIAFAWGWWAVRRAAGEPRVERRVLLLAPPLLVWLTLFAGLAFTGSRAGLLAALAAVTAQGLLAAGSRRRWWIAPVGIAVALLGLAVVASIGLQEGLGRILTTSVADVSWGARLREYGAALALWRRFPGTGTGLGTFRDAFPLVQPPDLDGTWWHPHSDLLEVLVTAGLAGAVLVAVGLWSLGRRLARVLRDGGRSEDRAGALAALGVVAAAGVHAGLDFGLTMPANALTLAVVLGATAAARVSASAQLDPARQDPAPVHALDLQEVEPAAHRGREGKRGRRRGGHGKSAQALAVEPDLEDRSRLRP
jgi:O-antigen ligase